jgi:hypothetical protein
MPQSLSTYDVDEITSNPDQEEQTIEKACLGTSLMVSQISINQQPFIADRTLS